MPIVCALYGLVSVALESHTEGLVRYMLAMVLRAATLHFTMCKFPVVLSRVPDNKSCTVAPAAERCFVLACIMLYCCY